MRETETIWMNGEFIDWHDAKVHVGVHGLHYGTGVFEGIRCYETPDGPAVFRLREHLMRLDNSAIEHCRSARPSLNFCISPSTASREFCN